MQIQLNVDTTFEVNELTDLQKFNDMMETMNMKINKSQIAREMGVDRRTVNKYLNGYRKPDRRNRESVVDAYYPIIRALLYFAIQMWFLRNVGER
ncbi:helix-turn-helix domain-containing protein [Exiguobacterium sp. s183]|uniref:helix-turn-helix domain-containing protein n=1 Tax=Exiguobacterium sp. s183 TaxID=2751262 RepID=UPI001BEB8383|nr:helix-turn-helix domain-containing protein [Exiguobacterium sp. s183]